MHSDLPVLRQRLFAGEVNIPVEVVWGRDDRSAPVDLGIAFYQKLFLNPQKSEHVLPPEPEHLLLH